MRIATSNLHPEWHSGVRYPNTQTGLSQHYKGVATTLAGDEGFEPPILGPEPSALPLGQSPMTVLLYPKRGVRIIKYEGFRVTFRDPATSTMKTSFQVMIALQIATGNSHPDPGTRTQCLTAWPIPNYYDFYGKR